MVVCVLVVLVYVFIGLLYLHSSLVRILYGGILDDMRIVIRRGCLMLAIGFRMIKERHGCLLVCLPVYAPSVPISGFPILRDTAIT